MCLSVCLSVYRVEMPVMCLYNRFHASDWSASLLTATNLKAKENIPSIVACYFTFFFKYVSNNRLSVFLNCYHRLLTDLNVNATSVAPTKQVCQSNIILLILGNWMCVTTLISASGLCKVNQLVKEQKWETQAAWPSKETTLFLLGEWRRLRNKKWTELEQVFVCEWEIWVCVEW
jgi:hypothetical protein